MDSSSSDDECDHVTLKVGPNVDPEAKPDVKKEPVKAAVPRSKSSIMKKNPQPKGPTRVLSCCFDKCQHEVDKLVECGLKVKVFPLNIHQFAFGKATLEAVHEIRAGKNSANFDVNEHQHYDFGHAELSGIAVKAYEVAEFLLETPNAAAIVSSRKGGVATKLLVACTLAALRVKNKKKAAQIITGRQPMLKHTIALKFLEAFKTWEEDLVLEGVDYFYNKN